MSIGERLGPAFTFLADQPDAAFPESVSGFTQTDLLETSPGRVALGYDSIQRAVIEVFDPATGEELQPNAFLNVLEPFFGLEVPTPVDKVTLLDLPGNTIFGAWETEITGSNNKKLSLNILGPDGQRIGTEVEIATESTRHPGDLSAELLGNGDILVSWEFQSNGYAYQVYDTSLTPRYDAPIEIPGPPRGLDSRIFFQEQDARLAVFYEVEVFDILTRRVSSEPRVEYRDKATGALLEGPLAPTGADSDAAMFALASAIATARTADGGLIALFPLEQDNPADGPKHYVEIYNADGSTHRSVFSPREIDFGVANEAVGLASASASREIKLLPLADGGYAVLFVRTDDPDATLQNFPDTDIYMSVYNSAEAQILPPTRLNLDDEGRQGGFDAEILSNGELLVSYFSLDGGAEFATVQRVDLAVPPPMPTEQADTLIGTAEDDVIASLAGNDSVQGLQGNDVLIGGLGSDTVVGGPGNDILFGDGAAAAYFGTAAANQVYRLYQATLDRAPDIEGHYNWTSRIATGERSIEEVAAGFVGSQEFTSRFQAETNTEFVTLLYNNVLGTDPDAQGLARWTGELESGASRAQVVLGFSDSPQFTNETNAAATRFANESLVSNWSDDVYRLYQATLDRAPDQGGMDRWTGELAEGTSTLVQVAAGFVGSPEFTSRFPASSNTDFVTLLYNNVLNSAPDTGGLNRWVGDLEGGASRAEVVLGFSQSPQFTAQTAPDVKQWMRDQGMDDRIDAGAGVNLVAGGQYADVFVFNAGETSATTVADLEPWDQIELVGFGYATAAEARAEMAQTAGNLVFNDQGVQVTFRDTTLADITDDMIIV